MPCRMPLFRIKLQFHIQLAGGQHPSSRQTVRARYSRDVVPGHLKVYLEYWCWGLGTCSNMCASMNVASNISPSPKNPNNHYFKAMFTGDI